MGDSDSYGHPSRNCATSAGLLAAALGSLIALFLMPFRGARR